MTSHAPASKSARPPRPAKTVPVILPGEKGRCCWEEGTTGERVGPGSLRVRVPRIVVVVLGEGEGDGDEVEVMEISIVDLETDIIVLMLALTLSVPEFCSFAQSHRTIQMGPAATGMAASVGKPAKAWVPIMGFASFAGAGVGSVERLLWVVDGKAVMVGPKIVVVEVVRE